MNATAERLTWSWRRVAFLGAVIFAIQWALLYSVTLRHTATTLVPNETSSYLFAPTGAVVEDTASPIEINDPTVFALPHRRGFSGSAWFGPAVTKHSLAEIRASPSFLRSEEALSFGNVGTRIQLTNSSIALDELPQPAATPLQLPPVAAPTSTVRVEGELATRRALQIAGLQQQRSATTLSNSIVQVGVDERGFQISARLLTSSGSPAADAEALTHARSVRFESVKKLDQSAVLAADVGKPKPIFNRTPTELMWGELVYRWVTLEPVSTNRPAGK